MDGSNDSSSSNLFKKSSSEIPDNSPQRPLKREECQTHRRPIKFVMSTKTVEPTIQYQPACDQCIAQAANIYAVKPLEMIDREIKRLECKAQKSGYGNYSRLMRQVDSLTENLQKKIYDGNKATSDWYNTILNLYKIRRAGESKYFIEYCSKEQALREAELKDDPKGFEKYVGGLAAIVQAIKALTEGRVQSIDLGHEPNARVVQPQPSSNDSRLVQQLSKDNSQLKSRLEEANVSYQKALQQLSTVKSSLKQVEESRLREAQSRVPKVLPENKHLLEQNQKLSAQIGQMNSRYAEQENILRSSQTQLKNQREEAEEALRRQTDSKEAIRKQLNEAKSQYMKLSTQSTNLKSKLKRNESELVQFKDAVENVQAQLKEERQANKALQQRIDQLSRNVPDTGQKGLEDKYEIQALKNDMLEKDREISRLRDQIGHLDKRLQEASTRNVQPGDTSSFQQVAPSEYAISKPYINQRQENESMNQAHQPQQLQRPPSISAPVLTLSAQSYGPSYSIPGQTYPARTSNSPVRTAVTSSNELFRDSRIVQSNGLLAKLLSYFGQASVDIKQVNLLFEGYGKTIEQFHAACDNKRNLLLLMELKQGGVYGGFTQNGWCNTNQYNLKKGFLLNSAYDKIAKWNNRAAYPTTLDPKSGPEFLPGMLGIDKLNRGFCKRAVYGDPYDYPDYQFFPRDPNVDTTKFDINTYEIWQITM